MKPVDVDAVLKILHKYGEFLFTTDHPKYQEMQDEIANLPKVLGNTNAVLDKIIAEILEEGECANADFERYKVEYLWQNWEESNDNLPQDNFCFGMERCVEIIDKYKTS